MRTLRSATPFLVAFCLAPLGSALSAPIDIVEGTTSLAEVERVTPETCPIPGDGCLRTTLGSGITPNQGDSDGDKRFGQYTVHNNTESDLLLFGVSNPRAVPLIPFSDESQETLLPSNSVIYFSDDAQGTRERLSDSLDGRAPEDEQQRVIDTLLSGVLGRDVPVLSYAKFNGDGVLSPIVEANSSRSAFFFEPAKLASSGFAITQAPSSNTLQSTRVNVTTQIGIPSTMIFVATALVCLGTIRAGYRSQELGADHMHSDCTR